MTTPWLDDGDVRPDSGGKETKRWFVTLLDRGSEICVEVEGKAKEHARRAARQLHPSGHIIHVEPAEKP